MLLINLIFEFCVVIVQAGCTPQAWLPSDLATSPLVCSLYLCNLYLSHLNNIVIEKLTISARYLLHLKLLLLLEPVQGKDTAGKGQLLVFGEGWVECRGRGVLSTLPTLSDPLVTHDGNTTSNSILNNRTL